MKITKKFSAWIVPLDYVEFTSGQMPFQVIQCVKLFDRITFAFQQGWFNMPKGIAPDVKKEIQKQAPNCLTVDSSDCTIFVKAKKAWARFENVVVIAEVEVKK